MQHGNRQCANDKLLEVPERVDEENAETGDKAGGGDRKEAPKQHHRCFPVDRHKSADDKEDVMLPDLIQIKVRAHGNAEQDHRDDERGQQAPPCQCPQKRRDRAEDEQHVDVPNEQRRAAPGVEDQMTQPVQKTAGRIVDVNEAAGDVLPEDDEDAEQEERNQEPLRTAQDKGRIAGRDDLVTVGVKENDAAEIHEERHVEGIHGALRPSVPGVPVGNLAAENEVTEDDEQNRQALGAIHVDQARQGGSGRRARIPAQMPIDDVLHQDVAACSLGLALEERGYQFALRRSRREKPITQMPHHRPCGRANGKA